MSLYHGRKGQVMMSVTGSGAAVSLTAANAFTIDMPTDYVEVTAFGDSNKTYVQGLPDASGSISAFWDDTSDALYDASRSTDGVNMSLYPSTDAPTKYWYGTACVDFSLDTSNSDAVKVAGNWKARGAWGQM